MWLQSMFKKGWLYVVLMVMVFSLQSCMDSGGDEYDWREFLNQDIETIKTHLTSNNIDAKFDTVSGIYYQTHVEGDGYQTVQRMEVDIHYRGLTLDGEEFVNTYSGAPETIIIGSTPQPGSSIQNPNPLNFAWGLDGWLLQSHREGDSASVYLPSYYAFQNKQHQNIAPNTPVVYHVKFEDIKLLSEDLEKIDQYIEDKGITGVEIDPKYGNRYAIHMEGNTKKKKNGAAVTLHYEGKLLNDEVFDSSFDGNAYQFTYGASNLITGFQMGVGNLHENDSATIFIPSIYGYGKSGSGENIPANAPLLFNIKMLRVSNL